MEMTLLPSLGNYVPDQEWVLTYRRDLSRGQIADVTSHLAGGCVALGHGTHLRASTGGRADPGAHHC